MISKLGKHLTALVAIVAASTEQALAMAKPPDGSGGAPELDGPGGIAAIAVVVSVALVLYNRSRDR